MNWLLIVIFLSFSLSHTLTHIHKSKLERNLLLTKKSKSELCFPICPFVRIQIFFSHLKYRKKNNLFTFIIVLFFVVLLFSILSLFLILLSHNLKFPLYSNKLIINYFVIKCGAIWKQKFILLFFVIF